MKYRRRSINFFFAQKFFSRKWAGIFFSSGMQRCGIVEDIPHIEERQSILPFELTAFCEEVVVGKMYFHGDSISIAGFPQATLFCMRRSLGEMELHRIWDGRLRASVCIRGYRIQFALERKEGYACNARSFGSRKKYFQLAGSVAFLALQLFFCPSLWEQHHSYFECFPIAPLFCLSLLPPNSPLAFHCPLSPFRIRASGGGYVSDKTTCPLPPCRETEIERMDGVGRHPLKTPLHLQGA